LSSWKQGAARKLEDFHINEIPTLNQSQKIAISNTECRKLDCKQASMAEMEGKVEDKVGEEKEKEK
jgi:hypothetical protein